METTPTFDAAVDIAAARDLAIQRRNAVYDGPYSDHPGVYWYWAGRVDAYDHALRALSIAGVAVASAEYIATGGN